MHFDLIQSLSLAGDAATPNDDRAGAGAAHAWVIDGGTDLGPPGLVGARGGAAWLADRASAAFSAAQDAPIAEMFAAVGERLIAAFAAERTREPAGRWELPVAAAFAARIGAHGLECGWLGDCIALHRRGDAVTRIGAVREARSREASSAAGLAAHGLGSMKTLAAPAIEALRVSRGRAGIRVLGVVPEVMAQVDTATVPCAPGDELILMTDGLAALVDSYGVYDEAGLAGAIVARGLAAVTEELRAIEREDAACARFPRFKRSDDATALWLRIGDPR